MNVFGDRFRVTIFGESHAAAVGVVIDGVKAGMALAEDDFTPDLDRRRSGARGTTPRHEKDRPRFLTGLFDGHTTGAPLTIVFDNENVLSGDYRNLVDQPRPSHSDFVAREKWHGANDPRGGGYFSGRLTVALVAAGVVAKKMIPDINISASLISVGGQSDATLWGAMVEQALSAHDSLGGMIECHIDGVPIGVGEPFFGSLESRLAAAIFSVPATRGIEFGTGFAAAAMHGSQHNDPIIDRQGHTATNNAGGIVGGISNGNQIVFRVAIKPTSSIASPQMTYNFATDRVEPLVIKGRHDACIALRASVVIEAAAAIVLADFCS
ncbi:MAG: chorismate synthase [Mucinivorans sp.]